MAEFGAVDGEPPGPAARRVERGEPEVVLGHEAQQAAVEVGQAQITHPSMLFRGEGLSNSCGIVADFLT